MMLSEIHFTPYIPTTILGLLGLVSGYLFFYFKNKNDNKLKEIQSVPSKDRIRAIEMSLNELGITIDTSNLDSNQKFILIKNILRAKTNRYLILSLTLVIFACLVTFLLFLNNKSKVHKTTFNDTLNTIHNIFINETLKAPPDIKLDEPDSVFYPTLYAPITNDMACTDEDDDGAKLKDTVILTHIVNEKKDSGGDYHDYILQNKNGVKEHYLFDSSSMSHADISWINIIMVVGRRLEINYEICGSGGVMYLTYVKPLRSYIKKH